MLIIPKTAAPDSVGAVSAWIAACQREALELYARTHDMGALEIAHALHEVEALRAERYGFTAPELVLGACAYCTDEHTAALRAFAREHELPVSDGCCHACYPRVRAEMLAASACDSHVPAVA